MFATKRRSSTTAADLPQRSREAGNDARAVEALRAQLFALRASIEELTVEVQSIRASAQGPSDASTSEARISDVA